MPFAKPANGILLFLRKNIFFVIAEDQSFCGAVAKHDGQHRRATENDLKYKIGTEVGDWVDI